MNQLCYFFLFFSKEIAIVSTFFLGYFFYSRKVFFQALVLTIFGLTVAATLKFIFKIPLLPHLGEGWSFPSGHMLSAVTFWGFLALELRNKIITTLIAFLLIGIGASLVYCHYHVVADVIAAAFFSLLLITFYRILLNVTLLGENEALLSLVFFIFSSVLIYFIHPFKSIFYISLGALFGLSIGSFLGKLSFFKRSVPFLVEIGLCFAGLAFIYYVTLHFNSKFVPPLFLRYFSLGIWIPFGPRLLLACLTPTGKR